MPRFFIHTNSPGDGAVPDDEGMEFDSVHDAKCQAVAYARGLLCDAGATFWDSADFELTATDENGLILFTMRVIGTQAPVIRRAAGALDQLILRADANPR